KSLLNPSLRSGGGGEEMERGREARKFNIQLPKMRLSKVFLLIPLLITAGVTAYFILGEAKIEIWPELDSFSSDIKVTVDKNAQSPNLSQKIIPGSVFEVATTVSKQFLSSGQKVQEKKAEGVIRVNNNSQVSQTLIKNTRFQAPLEMFQGQLDKGTNPWFRSQETVVIPSKSYKDINVIADSPGEGYNIKPSKFSIPGLAGSAQYTLVFGESFRDFKGGEKKTIFQVSSEDLGKAKESLLKIAEASSMAAVQAKLSSGYLLLQDSLKTDIADTASLIKAGTLLEKFNYEISARSAALTFKKEDLESLAKDFIASKIPEGKKIGPDSLSLEYSVFSLEPQLSKMVLALNMKAKTYSAPADESLLKNGLLGRTPNEAKLFLQGQQGMQKVKISLWPFWLRSIPADVTRIKLELKFTP
ncbi:MAG: hypothetical protein Q7K28_03695, partial [Candidatus Wildermuthbacteria bacterium]|nr:hypothetical protein [Candidatus Wildermuthbacteria bacterium]